MSYTKTKPAGWLTKYKSLIFSKLKSTDDLTLPWLLVLKVTNLTSFSFQSGRERKKSLNQNSVLRCDDLMWKSLRSELNCSGSVVHLRELSVLSSYLPSFPTPRPLSPQLHSPPPLSTYFSVWSNFPWWRSKWWWYAGDKVEFEYFCYKNKGSFIFF